MRVPAGGRVVVLELLAIMQSFVWAVLAGLALLLHDNPFVAVALIALVVVNIAGLVVFELRPWPYGWWGMTTVQVLVIVFFVAADVIDRTGYVWQVWSAFALSGAVGVVCLLLVRRAAH